MLLCCMIFLHLQIFKKELLGLKKYIKYITNLDVHPSLLSSLPEGGRTAFRVDATSIAQHPHT